MSLSPDCMDTVDMRVVRSALLQLALCPAGAPPRPGSVTVCYCVLGSRLCAAFAIAFAPCRMHLCVGHCRWLRPHWPLRPRLLEVEVCDRARLSAAGQP